MKSYTLIEICETSTGMKLKSSSRLHAMVKTDIQRRFADVHQTNIVKTRPGRYTFAFVLGFHQIM